MGEVVIPYKPRKWAKVLHEALTRWIVLVLHRRAGKTTAVLNHLQRDCIRIKNSRFAYIAPTFTQAKRIAWDIAKEMARPIPGVKINESELTITYPNGSKLYLFGSDNVDALRGLALWGGAQDEAQMQPPNLFSEVISKALADHLGYWIWLGTPKGKNQFNRTYENARTNPEWTAILRSIDDSLKDEEGETIDNLRKALEDDRKLVAQGEMTQEEFDQEWYCSFEAAIRGAYYAREIAEARRAGRIKPFSYDKSLKVHTIWDLGVGPQMAVGFYQRTGNELRMIDYWEGSNKDGLPEAIQAVQRKPYIYGKHFAPHDINATDISTGVTRKETAQKLGITFEEIPKLSVDDGINAGRLMWSRLFVNADACEYWLDAISQYRQEWDEKRQMFKETPYHDWTSHGADVHRYAAVVEKQMTNDEPKAFTPPPPLPVSRYEGQVQTSGKHPMFKDVDIGKMGHTA